VDDSYDYDADYLIETVAKEIEGLRIHRDKIALVGLSTGGFPVVRRLSKRLQVPSAQVFGLTVVKTADPVTYTISPRIRLDLKGMSAVLVDDSAHRGFLLEEARAQVGADETWTVALLANMQGLEPNIVGGFCEGIPPALNI
jgi:hypoxanthine phosphoribosyltransferase